MLAESAWQSSCSSGLSRELIWRGSFMTSQHGRGTDACTRAPVDAPHNLADRYKWALPSTGAWTCHATTSIAGFLRVKAQRRLFLTGKVLAGGWHQSGRPRKLRRLPANGRKDLGRRLARLADTSSQARSTNREFPWRTGWHHDRRTVCNGPRGKPFVSTAAGKTLLCPLPPELNAMDEFSWTVNDEVLRPRTQAPRT